MAEKRKPIGAEAGQSDWDAEAEGAAQAAAAARQLTTALGQTAAVVHTLGINAPQAFYAAGAAAAKSTANVLALTAAQAAAAAAAGKLPLALAPTAPAVSKLTQAMTAASAMTQQLFTNVQRLGNIGGVFLGLTASITGFIAAASPEAAETLSMSFQSLAAAVGEALLPYLVDVIEYLQNAAAFIRDMDDVTKDNIASWIAWGVQVLGVAFAISKLIGVLTLAVSAVKILASTIGLLGAAMKVLAANPLVLILTLGAAAALYFSGVLDTIIGKITGFIGKAAEAARGMGDLFEQMGKSKESVAIEKVFEMIDKHSANQADAERRKQILLHGTKAEQEQVLKVLQQWTEEAARGAEASEKRFARESAQKSQGGQQGRRSSGIELAMELQRQFEKAGLSAKEAERLIYDTDRATGARRIRKDLQPDMQRASRRMRRGQALPAEAQQLARRLLAQRTAAKKGEAAEAKKGLPQKKGPMIRRRREMTAQYSAVDEARKNFQIKALNLDELDQAKLDYQRLAYEKLVKIADNTDPSRRARPQAPAR